MTRPIPDLIAALRKGTCSCDAALALHTECAEVLEALLRPVQSQDDIVRMARSLAGAECSWGPMHPPKLLYIGFRGPAVLERFAALVAAAEREACAKTLEYKAAGLAAKNADGTMYDYFLASLAVTEVSGEIRARGAKEQS